VVESTPERSLEMRQRKYTIEFKTEAVGLVRSSGKPVTQVAKDLGIPENVLYRWMKVYGTAGDESGKITPLEHEELVRLRREIRTLKEEREILKKAAAYFAREQF
jgi:transposase